MCLVVSSSPARGTSHASWLSVRPSRPARCLYGSRKELRSTMTTTSPSAPMSVQAPQPTRRHCSCGTPPPVSPRLQPLATVRREVDDIRHSVHGQALVLTPPWHLSRE